MKTRNFSELQSGKIYWITPLLILLTCFTNISIAQDKVSLKISPDGKFFAIDNNPVFLNGMSYYGGCTITTQGFLTADLDEMVDRKSVV